MECEIIHLEETESTNLWLRQQGGAADLAVWTDFQTAGRGCGSNTWESERGQNLLFSILAHPRQMAASRQFQVSMAMSVALCESLPVSGLAIKWPNDIYWHDRKLAGILIESRLQGQLVRDIIVGVGLNVNQREFRSDAPNPVSLWQICGRETDREPLLHTILEHFGRLMTADVGQRYRSLLYRREGFHPYADREGAFLAELEDVEDDGHLLLRDDGGRQHRYAFKEVQFLIKGNR